MPHTTVETNTVDVETKRDRKAAMTRLPDTKADQELYKQDLKNLLAFVNARRSFEANGGFPWPNPRPSLAKRFVQWLHLMA